MSNLRILPLSWYDLPSPLLYAGDDRAGQAWAASSGATATAGVKRSRTVSGQAFVLGLVLGLVVIVGLAIVILVNVVFGRGVKGGGRRDRLSIETKQDGKP